MEPERINLHSLVTDGDWFEERVRAVMRAAAPELARRAQRDGVLAIIGQWLRPVLAAAAVVGLLATGALLRTTQEPDAAGAGVAQQLGVAEPALRWIEEERQPTISDLEMALMEETR